MLFRCPECRTRRRDYGLFIRHVKSTGHTLCNCGGYHYKHRKGSPFCEVNPMSAVLLASRAGTPDHECDEIALDIALTMPGRIYKQGAECPF